MMEAVVKKKRKKMALDIINTYAYVRTTDLAKVLDTSEYNTRTCINELYWDGLIIKIRGGAMSKQIRVDRPRQLAAQEALSLIHNEMAILLGEGDAIRYFIGLIPSDLKATFITGSPLYCIELLKKPNLQVVLLGGILCSLSKTVNRGEIFETLANVNADLCIMGNTPIDFVRDMEHLENDTARLKWAMFNAAKKTVVLLGPEKSTSPLEINTASTAKIVNFATELTGS